ncbi:MAG TPA: hypothetical protein DDZ41_02325 [Flavobacterium sp.]|nr:hypothetical protein [Flavobacterium sp.]
MITLNGCTKEEVIVQDNGVDNDTIAEVFEVTTTFEPRSGYSNLITLDPPIYSSDVILVYHLYDVVNGNDVWRLLPQTYYLGSGVELDYNFDFTKFDINLFLDSNVDLNTIPLSWTDNQTFRLVIVPGFFSKNAKVDYSNYNKTIEMLGYKDAKIIKIK